MKKDNIKKYGIFIAIGIILTAILEFILLESKTFNGFSLGRAITICGLIVFCGLHFLIGFKNLYKFLVKKRYLLSAILIVVSTIVGFLQNTYSIKEWLFTTNTVLSLWWNIKFYALLLVSFELFKILTNEKEGYSVIGAILITLSGAVQFNFNIIPEIIILGELILVFWNKFLKTDKNSFKYLLLFGILISTFLYTLMPKYFSVPMGYIFVSLIIWISIINKESLKANRIISVIALFSNIVIIIISNYINKLDVAEFINLKSQANFLEVFSYLINMLLPFNDIERKYLLGNFISVFPIPMVVSLYYMYKNENHIEFLLPTTIVSALLTIFCLSGFPEIISKIFGFNYVNIPACSMAVGLINLYILFYMISNIEERIFTLKKSMYLSIIIVCVVAFIPLPVVIASPKFIYLISAEFCVLTLLFLNFGDSRYKKGLLFVLVILTIMSGCFVNPIIKEKDEKIQPYYTEFLK